METSKTLEQAVKDKNLTGLHSVFYTILHEDPAFETGKFKQTLQYVQSKNIKGFMEGFEGGPFLAEEEWDEAYWAQMASELQDNFSKERISHIEEVGKKVYGSGAAPKGMEGVEKEAWQENACGEGRQGSRAGQQSKKAGKENPEEGTLGFFAICSAIVLAACWVLKRRK